MIWKDPYSLNLTAIGHARAAGYYYRKTEACMDNNLIEHLHYYGERHKRLAVIKSPK